MSEKEFQRKLRARLAEILLKHGKRNTPDCAKELKDAIVEMIQDYLGPPDEILDMNVDPLFGDEYGFQFIFF